MEIGEEINAWKRISGQAIMGDLCNRIAERLARSNDLRSVDSYSGYSATVTVALQLQDVDRIEVSAQIAIGDPIPAPPPQIAAPGRIALNATVTPSDAREPEPTPNLERAVDGSMVESAETNDGIAAERPKRYYTPRNAQPGVRAAK